MDKWKFLSPVLKQPRLRQQQQYEDFSILELLVMLAPLGRAKPAWTRLFLVGEMSQTDFRPLGFGRNPHFGISLLFFFRPKCEAAQQSYSFFYCYF